MCFILDIMQVTFVGLASSVCQNPRYVLILYAYRILPYNTMV